MNSPIATPVDPVNPADLKNCIFEEKGDLAVLTLNRPDVVNCLSFRLSDKLVAVFEYVRRSNTIKFLVLKGAGGNFSREMI